MLENQIFRLFLELGPDDDVMLFDGRCYLEDNWPLDGTCP